ncbi:shikimate dehydrogenase family protein [Parasediminibacterium sp. JCM 36343]|uniref:shikimate dehydrogenase family protein n=1 Tax=Parasediminibacterium sp. JCM 36343 TaxID=3374279 RepID=UPI003979E73B
MVNNTIDESKRLFAIIGFPLTHSFSERYFTDKFIREGITDALFNSFSIEDIDSLHHIVATHTNLHGFAITIPHKKNVLAFLNEATTDVQQMGASNCVRIKDGKLSGFNTDVVGFEQSFIKKLQAHHRKALILGSGGAAAAVEFVLKKLGIVYQFVSRKKGADNLTYSELTPEVMEDYTVIINTTPLGTFPKIDDAAAIPYTLLTDKHYLFDLVYNPAETKFLRLGKEQGAATENGYEMLVIQAEENWKIWNS